MGSGRCRPDVFRFDSHSRARESQRELEAFGAFARFWCRVVRQQWQYYIPHQLYYLLTLVEYRLYDVLSACRFTHATTDVSAPCRFLCFFFSTQNVRRLIDTIIFPRYPFHGGCSHSSRCRLVDPVIRVPLRFIQNSVRSIAVSLYTVDSD